ncbi:hypothetical protein GOD78_30285 [Sinorhizobium medicae]|uniref:hypothetical protein n=1 Tax=Sinorhizobium medicae TaxID=110321 RepID=UPI000FD9ECA1|nr:hypothetical protein [Sinorhizobium medicae]MDX0605412.1 hypothetical protein [Sinorhizobium medicae]MDX0760324.1 hypothetical protein [Sinorhizobium medicae]MDX0766437.1 hypothetical protein [Sinorhizobium medicae]MDX0797031.1 hypothetical protein [Sinorhizobium medicae]MDX0821657.1 hypothetical protein [Sinorhizobium medicae]
MTPAERARHIDRKEFEAECRAIRQRALSYANAKRQAERALFEAWLGREPAQPPKRHGLKPGFKGRTLTFNGVTKTVSEWSSETGISINTINGRLRAGLPIEEVLKPGKITTADRATRHAINGESRTLQEWADHIGIRYATLTARINKGRTLAEALAMPKGRNTRTPGAPNDFGTSRDTGGRGALQETPNLTFSQKA